MYYIIQVELMNPFSLHNHVTKLERLASISIKHLRMSQMSVFYNYTIENIKYLK